MKYKLYTEGEIPLIVPKGHVMSGSFCEFESPVPINKGDKIILDPDDMKMQNLDVREVEVLQNPTHIIKGGLSVLTVKKIS